jgi:hypothetical protein
MPKSRKIPKTSKPDMMVNIKSMLLEHYDGNTEDIIDYLLHYFSSWDLEAIQFGLEKKLNQRVL